MIIRIQHNISKAFTLAEVLVTLVVIGIIAALTIPNLLIYIDKSVYTTQLKSSYSTLQQAFKLLEIDNGGSIVSVFSGDTTTNNGNGYALNAFLTKMNYAKNCGNGMGCWYNSTRYYLGGTPNTQNLDSTFDGIYEKALLANGSMFSIWVRSTDCAYDAGSGPLDSNVCASIAVDINGAKKPNTIGRDYFHFWITKSGIYPFGIHDDGSTCETSSSSYSTSWGCAAKVLTESGMNY